ncbi:unnamed protein product, partial [Laminaria digitata]
PRRRLLRRRHGRPRARPGPRRLPRWLPRQRSPPRQRRSPSPGTPSSLRAPWGAPPTRSFPHSRSGPPPSQALSAEPTRRPPRTSGCAAWRTTKPSSARLRRWPRWSGLGSRSKTVRRSWSAAVINKPSFETDAAVGEAELGLSNRQAALQAAEQAFASERDFCVHQARGLESSRATREDSRRAAQDEDKRSGKGDLLLKRTPPAPYDPVQRSLRVVPAERADGEGAGAGAGAAPPTPAPKVT